MSTEKISVIVPVYKVEPYLHRCIDSILEQTYRNLELILIDDGSPDNCGAICDEYAAMDHRITVIHQENGGLSAARNTGLDWVFANSDSPWITFVDSDDVLAPIMLETLYHEAVKHKADIAITNPATFEDDAQLENEGKFVGATLCVTGEELTESFYKGEDLVSVTAWGKLIRRKLYQDLRFPVGKIHEDEATTPILMYLADRVAIVRSWLYFYGQREGSIMQTGFSLKRFDHIDALISCVTYFQSNGADIIAQLAKEHLDQQWARMTITARQEGLYRQLPSRYRMGILRACWILLTGSLRRGGMQYAARRAGNLIKLVKK